MQNHYFDKNNPFRPYTNTLDATAGTVPPDNALRVALPFAFKDGIPQKENVPDEYKGLWPCEKDGTWVLIPDFRGKQGYLDGQPHEIDDFGPLPDGWSADPPPPTPEEIAEQEKQQLRQDAQEFMMGFMEVYNGSQTTR